MRPFPWVIVGSRFHAAVVDRLVDGATACLRAKGVAGTSLHVDRVPGAWELPQLVAARLQAPTAGVVAVGCVVRGETPHFDFLCAETSRALMELAITRGVPLGFGLLTCDTMEQALARAGGEHGDKGWEAAEAAWDLAEAMSRLRGEPRDG